MIRRRLGTVLRYLLRRRARRGAEPAPPPELYTALLGRGSVVPVQIEAYFLALNRYVDEGAVVLDVGFGLGYGLNILAIKASQVNGVEVDEKALQYCRDTVLGRNPRLGTLEVYDGQHLPFAGEAFRTVTCIDVLEHVREYDALIDEMLRVCSKGVFISTPNRRPEYTRADGTPANHWHLREWSAPELDEILKKHARVDWNFLDGPFDGPFSISASATAKTLALAPFLWK
jgi:2-polyprenyl-3-methyl-5-hydroxy-6-metoxy-1,4-benzoquinol methylase